MRVRVLGCLSAGLLLASEVPDDVLPDLIETLHDPEPKVRANVALVLARQPQVPDQTAKLLLPLMLNGAARESDIVFVAAPSPTGASLPRGPG